MARGGAEESGNAECILLNEARVLIEKHKHKSFRSFTAPVYKTKEVVTS